MSVSVVGRSSSVIRCGVRPVAFVIKKRYVGTAVLPRRFYHRIIVCQNGRRCRYGDGGDKGCCSRATLPPPRGRVLVLRRGRRRCQSGQHRPLRPKLTGEQQKRRRCVLGRRRQAPKDLHVRPCPGGKHSTERCVRFLRIDPGRELPGGIQCNDPCL